MNRGTFKLVLLSTVTTALVVGGVLYAHQKHRVFKGVKTQVELDGDREGYGREARVGDIARVSYTLTLEDGTMILEDSSSRFIVGGGGVIVALDDVTTGMRVGGHRRAIVPPGSHWGRLEYGTIPADSRLILTLDLLDVERADPGGSHRRLTRDQRAMANN